MSTLFSRPLPKLVAVMAFQLAILLSVIGFKQYTIRTTETVLLKTVPVDPTDLVRGDIEVRYEISTIDVGELPGDDEFFDSVYVELQEDSDGYWNEVAVHDDRERSFDGTVLIKGEIEDEFSRYPRSVYNIEYGIGQVFIEDGSGDDLPTGTNHTVAVEVKVDRFGNSEPQRFIVDGEPYDLGSR